MIKNSLDRKKTIIPDMKKQVDRLNAEYNELKSLQSIEEQIQQNSDRAAYAVRKVRTPQGRTVANRDHESGFSSERSASARQGHRK